MPLSERAQAIIEQVRYAKTKFGDNYPKKFGGAAAVEILRKELADEGIPVSRRDVYIKGCSAEIDLLIPKVNSSHWIELLFEPCDVALALEVKKTGAYGEKGRAKIKEDFAQLAKLGVTCAYLTFEDRENYRWRPTTQFLEFPCFALAWHKGADGRLIATQEGENWEAFISFVRSKIA